VRAGEDCLRASASRSRLRRTVSNDGLLTRLLCTNQCSAGRRHPLITTPYVMAGRRQTASRPGYTSGHPALFINKLTS
jgi:hypothetical protein